MPRVTIVIRAKNEEFWLGKCLGQIAAQDFKDYEVVLVDSGSTDNTREIFRAGVPRGKVVDSPEPFLPGRAINKGIAAGSGELAVILSAHCVPASERWLGALVRAVGPSDVCGAYGRQLPLPSSQPADTRDLLNLFGVEPRLHRRDTFFHNANSIVRRSVWEDVPFDPDTPHIEDRIWAEHVIPLGWTIAYEPEAAVYHHHGVNHLDDRSRASSISDILTARSLEEHTAVPAFLLPENEQTLYCVLGHDDSTAAHLAPLLEELERRCPPGRVLVHSATPKAMKREHATVVPRVPEDDGVGMVEVLARMVAEASAARFYPTCVVYLNLRRHAELRPESIGRLVERFYEGTYDSVFTARKEYSGRRVWVRHGGTYRAVDSDYLDAAPADPVYIAEYGLGMATRPEFIRSGQLVGPNVGIIEIQGSS